MKNNSAIVCSIVFGVLTAVASASSLPELVSSSTQIFANKQGSANPIPNDALKAAKGVAILDVTKGGFIIGGTGGDGVVLVRSKQGLTGALGISSWSAPIPISISGGSFGAQIGGSNTKTIILLNSDQAVKVFTQPGKIGWDAKASGTAGADTQGEQAGGLLSDVDVKLYHDTNGLYGGATIGGVTLAINDPAIKDAYGSGIYVRDILEGKVKSPDYAKTLTDLVDGKR